MNKFNPTPARVQENHLHGYPFTAEHFRDGQWRATAKFQSIDEKRVLRHVLAIGGMTRLCRGSVVLSVWCDGVAINAEGAAA